MTPVGEIYLAYEESDVAFLSRTPREDGKSRAIFTREELALFVEEVAPLGREDRMATLGALRKAKLGLPGSRFEKIAPCSDEPEGWTVTPEESREIAESKERAQERKKEMALGEEEERRRVAGSASASGEGSGERATGERASGSDAENLRLTY